MEVYALNAPKLGKSRKRAVAALIACQGAQSHRLMALQHRHGIDKCSGLENGSDLAYGTEEQ